MAMLFPIPAKAGLEWAQFEQRVVSGSDAGENQDGYSARGCGRHDGSHSPKGIPRASTGGTACSPPTMEKNRKKPVEIREKPVYNQSPGHSEVKRMADWRLPVEKGLERQMLRRE